MVNMYIYSATCSQTVCSLQYTAVLSASAQDTLERMKIRAWNTTSVLRLCLPQAVFHLTWRVESANALADSKGQTLNNSQVWERAAGREASSGSVNINIHPLKLGIQTCVGTERGRKTSKGGGGERESVVVYMDLHVWFHWKSGDLTLSKLTQVGDDNNTFFQTQRIPFVCSSWRLHPSRTTIFVNRCFGVENFL